MTSAGEGFVWSSFNKVVPIHSTFFLYFLCHDPIVANLLRRIRMNLKPEVYDKSIIRLEDNDFPESEKYGTCYVGDFAWGESEISRN